MEAFVSIDATKIRFLYIFANLSSVYTNGCFGEYCRDAEM